MANDAVLSASSRANLLSLQNTQRAIDITQLRLATGKKVNSALDNPQSFFTAQALSNRASDLTRLLDGIGQSIQTIVEADKGVSALTKMVEQADAIVNSARDELAASDGVARMVGTVDLRTAADITTLAGGGTFIATGDIIRITTTNDAGTQIVENITITAGDTGYTLAAKITDQFADNRAGEITANINSTTGVLEIQSKGGRSFKIGDTSGTTTTGVNLTLTGYTALGLGRYFEVEQRGGSATTSASAQALITAGNTVKSISMYESAGNLADAGDVISGTGTTFIDASGNALIAGVSTNDTLTIIANRNSGSATSGAVTLTTGTTFQDVVDQINANTNINTYLKATFDSLSGQLQFTSLSDAVENIDVRFTSVAAGVKTFNLGFGDTLGNLDDIGNTGGTTITTTGTYDQIIAFNSSSQALDGYANDYNTVRAQINDLVKDAEYRGVNLLRGDNLTTYFNEDNTSKLVTYGKTFTADGLGMVTANFSSSAAIENIATLTKTALNTVRTFGASLANNLAIIQARQTFTQETINTLKAGSDALTNADLNEEGANLLALQTAQQLGVTALSLASQSQQSVLRLF